MKNSNTKLSWVLIDKEIHSVEEFTNVPVGKRPAARCPVCEQPVILKLGQERAHHAAHYEGAICASTQPETALHLNVKYHIWNKLRTAKTLLSSWHCSNCQKEITGSVAKEWDEVALEYSISSWRADIALVKNGQAMCVIEICVTHPTEHEKIEALKKEGIRVIEVEATEELYQPPSAWVPNLPLPYLIISGNYLCKSCRNALEKERIAVSKKSQKPKPVVKWKVAWMRFADLFYPSGEKIRETYKVMIQYHSAEDHINKILLTRGLFRSRWSPIEVFYPPWKENLRERIHESFLQELIRAGTKDVIRDSPMSWIPWDKKIALFVHNRFSFNERYQWKSQINSWCVVPEMENKRWDEALPISRINFEMMLEVVAKNHGIAPENGWERNEFKLRWEHQLTGEYISDTMLEGEACELFLIEKRKKFPFID